MTRPTGTSTWIDLGTTDLEAAQRFYEGLFGWSFEDTGEEYMHYNMVRNRDGKLVGGAVQMPPQDEQGNPFRNAWDVFLAAEDIDAVSARVEPAGGSQTFPPSVVGPAGRFSMVKDATGADVGLWEAGETEGYEFTGEPGSPVWFELMTHEFDAAQRFYTDVVDAQFVPLADPQDGSPTAHYATNGPQESASWGLCDARGVMPAEATGWRVYLAVEDADAAIARIRELGGQILDGPVDSPFGRIATVSDPTGATFQISAMSQATPEA